MAYTLQKGEALTIPFFVEEGNPASVTVTAKLRKQNSSDPAVSAQVAFRAADGPELAGWNVTITRAVSATLSLGVYQLALSFTPTAGGDPEYSAPVSVTVKQSPFS